MVNEIDGKIQNEMAITLQKSIEIENVLNQRIYFTLVVIIEI